jgi:hypothetical protein
MTYLCRCLSIVRVLCWVSGCSGPASVGWGHACMLLCVACHSASHATQDVCWVAFNTWITSCAFFSRALPTRIYSLHAKHCGCCELPGSFAVPALPQLSACCCLLWARTVMAGVCSSAASVLHHLLCVGAAVAHGARAPIAWMDWIAAGCVCLLGIQGG